MIRQSRKCQITRHTLRVLLIIWLSVVNILAFRVGEVYAASRTKSNIPVPGASGRPGAGWTQWNTSGYRSGYTYTSPATSMYYAFVNIKMWHPPHYTPAGAGPNFNVDSTRYYSNNSGIASETTGVADVTVTRHVLQYTQGASVAAFYTSDALHNPVPYECFSYFYQMITC